MIRKNAFILISMLAATTLVACTDNTDPNENVSTEASTEDVSVVAETVDENADTADTGDSNTDEEQIPDADFFSYELKEGKTAKVDLGKDGTFDTITLNKEHSDEYGIDFYSLEVNDQIIDILSEEDAPYFQIANCYFVHKDEFDSLFVSLEGDAGKRQVVNYMWTGASMEKGETVDGFKYFGIDEAEGAVMLTEELDMIDKWEVATDYYFVSGGLSTADKFRTITNPKALTLKQDVEFEDDESGEGPKSAKAGDKISPSCLAYGDSVMGFTDENGESLGYLSIDQKEENGEQVFYFGETSAKDLFEVQ